MAGVTGTGTFAAADLSFVPSESAAESCVGGDGVWGCGLGEVGDAAEGCGETGVWPLLVIAVGVVVLVWLVVAVCVAGA